MLKKIIVIIAVVGFILSSVSLGLGAEEVTDGKQSIGDEINRWAVIIGISDYKGNDNFNLRVE